MHRDRRTAPFAFATLLFAASAAFALDEPAANPYAGQQQRAIKSLTDADIAGLLAGHGAGFAKTAELNGYPGPAHTLELAERLELSAEQREASSRLMREHQTRSREIGARLVDAERALERLFAQRTAESGSVAAAAETVGLLQAQLRAEHLITHLSQTALLSAEQVRRYGVARGYAVADDPASKSPAERAPARSHPH